MDDKKLEHEIADLSRRVERLRILYQQYFMGIDRHVPSVQHDQLERALRESPLNEVLRSSLKFRFSALIQKYRTYEVYWTRILREIETGKFRREVMLGTGTLPRREEPAPRAEDDVSQSRPPPEPAPEPAPAKPPASPPSSADPVRELFDAFVQARVSVGLPVTGLTEGAFRTSLAKQRQLQAEKLGTPEIVFRVVAKEGRVVLVASPGTGAPKPTD